MRLILIALTCLPLAACDFGSMDALEIATTGHDMAGNTPKAALLAQNQPVEALAASSASAAAPVVQTAMVEDSSSSVYVPPLTESCAQGESLFRVWTCDSTGHRSYI